MRIAYLINGLNGGGAAAPIPALFDCMQSLGHEPTLLALMPQDARACPMLDAAGIPYEILGRDERDYLGSSRALIRRLRALRPDVIWTSLTRATIFGQLAGRLLDLPVVSWQHNAFLKPGNKRLLRFTRRLSRRWLADSETVKDFAVRELGLTREKIDVWQLFVADPGQKVASPWREDEPFRIGSLGRLHPNKRYDTLVHAAAILRDRDPALAAGIAFVVAGEGEERPKLERDLAALDVGNVDFPGFDADPGSFLASLHAYVQPSRNEGLCIAAHEAMHAGLPVIATPVGEIARSVVDGETGLLFAIGDSAALADAVEALVREPARAAQMGAASRQRIAERFGSEAFRRAGAAALAAIERELAGTPGVRA